MIKNNEETIQLAELVNMNSPEAVLEEVKYNFIQSYPVINFRLVREVYKDFLDLYNGRHSGYKNFSTPYHDIEHTTNIFLAFSRLFDGYNIENKKLPVDKVIIGMLVTLLHDNGYIRKKGDRAIRSKQINYIQRSADFIKVYMKKTGFDEKDFVFAGKIMQCTDMEADIFKIKFANKSEKTIGYMAGTADLTGQMSARTYLERLVMLYDELAETNIIKKSAISEILKRKIDFYRNKIWDRFESDFEGLFKYHTVHFMKRYRVDCNLYMESMEKQIEYLEEILENSPRSFVKKLKRKE